MGPRAGVEAATRQMVPGRQTQRVGELPRPACARRQERPRGADLGGRTSGPGPAHHLWRAARRCKQIRECAEEPGRRARRPRRDLSPDGTRSGGRHARVRPNRGGPHGRIRRLLRRVAAGPDQRRGREGARHRGWRLSARLDRAAEAECRRRAHGDAQHRARRGAPPYRSDGDVQDRARPVVVGGDGAGAAGMPPRSDGCGRSALHPLHVRYDREAERHSAHDRRLSDARVRHHQVGVRSQGLRRVLVHCGCRLGHRPFLRRIRTARPRRYGSDVRGRSGPSRQGPILVDLREPRRDGLLYPRRPRSARS